MLPSTLLTGSASAVLWLSRLNSTPHTIAVYASHPPSPATTQHSLPGARYGLPAPVSHRLDNASFPGAQTIHSAAKQVWIASSQSLSADRDRRAGLAIPAHRNFMVQPTPWSGDPGEVPAESCSAPAFFVGR
jgi:hypothetical protein